MENRTCRGCLNPLSIGFVCDHCYERHKESELRDDLPTYSLETVNKVYKGIEGGE